MSKQKTLITGGAGFIGSHLVKFLVENDYEVVVLDNCINGCKISASLLAKIQFIKGDVRDFSLVRDAMRACRYVVHLAALVGVEEVQQKQMETIETELIGTQNIVKAAIEEGVEKIIYTSSSAVYKDTIGDSSRESDRLCLANDYAVAKRMNELYLQSLTAEKGVQTVSLRLFNVYGEGQDERMVIPRFFQRALKDEPIIVFGDGSQTRDFTIVDDVSNAIFLLLKTSSVNGILNIANGAELTIRDLAFMIKKITQSSSSIEFRPFPKERIDYKVKKRIGNTDKLFKAIGFRPSFSPLLGLEKCFSETKNLINE